MATQLTIQTGLVITPAPAAADVTGNYVVPTSTNGVLIRIINGGGSSINVTLDDVNSVAPEGPVEAFDADVLVAVPAGATRVFRVKDVSRFKDASNGRISWTYSGVTSVTVDVFEL